MYLLSSLNEIKPSCAKYHFRFILTYLLWLNLQQEFSKTQVRIGLIIILGANGLSLIMNINDFSSYIRSNINDFSSYIRSYIISHLLPWLQCEQGRFLFPNDVSLFLSGFCNVSFLSCR